MDGTLYHSEEEHTGGPKPEVWIASVVTMSVLSVVGMVMVGIIPLMQKFDLHYGLQFFIAVAVGALSGDAALHLIPHALGAHSHEHAHPEHNLTSTTTVTPLLRHEEETGATEEEDEHLTMMLKGLTMLGGFYGFLIIQRIMLIISNWRARRAEAHNHDDQHDHGSGHGNKGFVEDGSVASTGPRLCSIKPLHDTDTSVIYHTDSEDVEVRDRYCPSRSNTISFMNRSRSRPGSILQQKPPETEATHIANRATTYNSQLNHNAHADHHGHGHVHDHRQIDEQGSRRSSFFVATQGEYRDRRKSVVSCATTTTHPHNANELEHVHHGHGHVHEVPGSVWSLMAMVIMGDGLHNLMDGLAVGAAFSNDIALGVGTSVAILCHELPHEIGDYAMLVQAGMSLKMALLFNVVSSVLAFIGMVMGVLLATEESEPWILMVVAGTFFYIAYINMLPELNTSDTENTVKHLLIQISGFAIGTAILAVIAAFEEQISAGIAHLLPGLK